MAGMEKSADICVRLSFSSRRGGFSRLGLLRRLLALNVRTAFSFGVKMLQVF